MADFLNYNSLSKDPVAMEEELNKVQMKLREEQLARHKLEGEMERIRRHNKHLQYNLKVEDPIRHRATYFAKK